MYYELMRELPTTSKGYRKLTTYYLDGWWKGRSEMTPTSSSPTTQASTTTTTDGVILTPYTSAPMTISQASATPTTPTATMVSNKSQANTAEELQSHEYDIQYVTREGGVAVALEAPHGTTPTNPTTISIQAPPTAIPKLGATTI